MRSTILLALLVAGCGQGSSACPGFALTCAGEDFQIDVCADEPVTEASMLEAKRRCFRTAAARISETGGNCECEAMP